MAYQKKSFEDRKAEAEELRQKIEQGVADLVSSEDWKKYLDFCKSFHRYSFSNMMLIYMQMPQATMVAGFQAWKKKGRQVRKGEKGLRIFAPARKKYTEEDAQTGEEVERERMYFFPTSVFDISQTDEIEDFDGVTEVVHLLDGEDEVGAANRIREWATQEGIVIVEDSPRLEFSPANGFTVKNDDGAYEIHVRSGLSDAQRAKTMIHEAAHIVCGHVDDIEEYVEHRGVSEVEAESTAYVVGGLIGLDTSDYSFGYVAGWSGGDPEVVRDAGTTIMKAVTKLMNDVFDASAAELVTAG